MTMAMTLGTEPARAYGPVVNRMAPLLLAGYAALLFFHGLGTRDLNSSHEARAAQNAQMLLEDGDWLLPHLFDRHVELQKPPLYYWLVAAAAWLRGGAVDAWATRLPAALSGLGCVLFLYYLGVKRGRARAGLCAGLVLATFVHFTWLARVGRIDMPLTFAVTVALGSFELGKQQRGWRLVGYTALALGVLLKGPIALVLATVVAVANRPVWRGWRESSLWWGIPWLLLLTAPWFLAANARTGGRLWDVFFWHHNLERGLGGSEALAVHPWWFYGPRALIDLLPWSLVAPLALWWQRRQRVDDPDGRAGLRWFAAIFVFLSCMSFKRADYLLPAYPGLALFLGTFLDRYLFRWAQERDSRTRALVVLATILLAYAGAWCSYNTWVVPTQEADWPYQRLAREIRRRTDGPVIFFRAEAHLLAFHVGRPLDTILEWENLEVWANMDFPVYFVMPAECAQHWRQEVKRGELVEVLRSSDWVQGPRERALVVLRSAGKSVDVATR
jgi:4-amino-4-deoxy-L-arabinose transferase-like glycosyltransferase